MSTAAIELAGVGKRFPAPQGGYTALEGLDLRVEPSRFVSLVGPSGCGKTTLLNLIAGLDAPSAGQVVVFGETLDGLNRRASYLFQQDALLEWKTVEDNAALGLAFRGRPATERRSHARAWLERVGLAPFARHFPSQLSGGMRKRLALAQALMVEPDILLMDEPFSALDVHTRLRMESELLELWSSARATVVFVTHDLEEAIALSDEVCVLSAGPASRVVSRHAVDLERPRNLIDLKTEPAFHALYREIWHTLREQVLKGPRT